MLYKIYFKTSHSFYRHWLGSLLSSRVGDTHKKFCLGTYLVVQWLIIHLPIQGSIPGLGTKIPYAAKQLSPRPQLDRLRLCASNPGGTGSITGWGTKTPKPHTARKKKKGGGHGGILVEQWTCTKLPAAEAKWWMGLEAMGEDQRHHWKPGSA